MRLGAPHLGGATSIKRASFFRGVNWNQLYRRSGPGGGCSPGLGRPPFVPRLDSPSDVRYFDRDFVSQPPVLSEVDAAAEAAAEEANDAGAFEGFDYVHPSCIAAAAAIAAAEDKARVGVKTRGRGKIGRGDLFAT